MFAPENVKKVAVVDLYREDLNSLGFGVGDLGKAPVGVHGRVAADNDHGLAGAQFTIQLIFPIDTSGYTLTGIVIKEYILKSGLLKPLENVPGDLVISAAMADENPAHIIIPAV